MVSNRDCITKKEEDRPSFHQYRIVHVDRQDGVGNWRRSSSPATFPLLLAFGVSGRNVNCMTLAWPWVVGIEPRNSFETILFRVLSSYSTIHRQTWESKNLPTHQGWPFPTLLAVAFHPFHDISMYCFLIPTNKCGLKPVLRDVAQHDHAHSR